MIKGRKILTEDERSDVVESFTLRLEPVASLAKRYKYSRHGIYKVLKRAGVDIPESAFVPVSCTACGAVIQHRRHRVRKSKHLFCNEECYHSWLRAGAGRDVGPYVCRQHGMRVARHVVGQVFALQPGHIVHHKDRNTRNNDIFNLLVFACQGDHVRHHRGFEVPILFDGAAYRP